MQDQLSGLKAQKKQQLGRKLSQVKFAGLSSDSMFNQRCDVATSTHPRLCCIQEQCSELGFADL